MFGAATPRQWKVAWRAHWWGTSSLNLVLKKSHEALFLALNGPVEGGYPLVFLEGLLQYLIKHFDVRKREKRTLFGKIVGDLFFHAISHNPWTFTARFRVSVIIFEWHTIFLVDPVCRRKKWCFYGVSLRQICRPRKSRGVQNCVYLECLLHWVDVQMLEWPIYRAYRKG